MVVSGSFEFWHLSEAQVLLFVLCEESLVLQANGHLLATDIRHVVALLKWILEQFAMLHVIMAIESMGIPLVAAVMTEHGLLVQHPTVKVRSWLLSSSDSKIRIIRIYNVSFLVETEHALSVQCVLCGAYYVSWTHRHIHLIDEHNHSVIGKHLREVIESGD